jgi:hypothetical protein
MTDDLKGMTEGGGEVSRRDVLIAVGAVAATTMTGGDAGAAEEKFNPNKCTFAQGIERIKKAIEGADGFGRRKIVTSRDPGVDKILDKLRVTNVPGGFTKYHLPVFFEGGPGAQFFISVGAPNTEVPRHSHDEGDGMRFIVAGSIVYEGKELTSGDWMFIPKGQPYSMKVGRAGVTVFYCYQCCCG